METKKARIPAGPTGNQDQKSCVFGQLWRFRDVNVGSTNMNSSSPTEPPRGKLSLVRWKRWLRIVDEELAEGSLYMAPVGLLLLAPSSCIVVGSESPSYLFLAPEV